MNRSNLFSIALLASLAALAGCGGPEPVVPPDAFVPPVDGGPPPDARPTCPEGTELCGSTCIDTNSSRQHCGACNDPCATGEACIDGLCDVICPSTQTECDGRCSDTATDRLNCGGCGVTCAEGEICVDSDCVLSCPGAQAACGTVCTDTQSDPQHCGECSTTCAPGQVCSAGDCATECAAGLTECGASCVDTRYDPMHCGECGTVCPGADGASGICVEGDCIVACNTLEGDCNADLAIAGGDGCETALATDPDQCGACGRVCVLPNAVTGCAAGECTLASCDTGWGDCDGVVENGCETDTQYDDFSCGACGTVCAAGDTCVAGTCATTAGETCNDAIPLVVGANTVMWTAMSSDVMTAPPACSTAALAGPDVVLSYTATADVYVRFTIAKPASMRWHAVTMLGTCSRTAEHQTCVSESTATTMSTAIAARAGQTVYLVVSDTSTGTDPLSNPLNVTVATTPLPCVPGAGGILGGGTRTRIPTGLASFVEYYVAADESPTGFAWFGGTADLYRVRKDGTGLTDVVEVSDVGSDHLGYAMLLDGSNVYTLESSTTGTSEHLFRISTDGGATFSVQDYATFATAPLDDFRALTSYGGRIYLVTEEDTAGTATQIWSVDAAATTLPATATLEASITTEGDCNAIARDAMWFYLACPDAADRIVRVPAAGGAPTLITTAVALSTTVNALHGDDVDGDGVFDVLYVRTDNEQIDVVCGPTGATPFAGTAIGLGGGTASYGLALDRAGDVLWTIDDDNRDLITIR